MAESTVVERQHPTNVYQDLPLNSNDNFRILDLHSGKRDDEIFITLRVDSLGASPEYEALSYTWGEANEGHGLLVNDGNQLTVTDNLFRALRYMRKADSSRTLWIDAICINQADVEERNQQVKIMGSIYESATCVNIWLGEYHPTVATGLKLMYYLFGETISLTNPSTILNMWRQNPLIVNKALKMTTHQWHHRAWTIQEFIVAKEAYLCIGAQRILVQEDRISGLSGYLIRHKSCDWDNIPFVNALSTRMILRQNRKDGPILRILEVPQVLANSKALDRRDIVYSLLGLIVPEERRLINVDYNMSSHRVYAQATFASLKASGSFEVLSYVRVNKRRRADLSAWVVNFASLPFRDVGSLTHRREGLKNVFAPTRFFDPFTSPLQGCDASFSARLDELGLSQSDVEMNATDKLLSVHGIKGDEIAATSPLLATGGTESSGGNSTPKLDDIFHVVRQAAILAKKALQSQGEAGSACAYGLNLLQSLTTIMPLDAEQIHADHAEKWLKVVKAANGSSLTEVHLGALRNILHAWTMMLWPQSQSKWLVR